MKKGILSVLKTLFCICYTCIALISCDNFLDSGDFQNKLLSDIDYANARECVIHISKDTEAGKFLSTDDIKCKAGYITELKYKLEKDDWIFLGLETVKASDTNVILNDIIEYQVIDNNQKTGLFVLRIKILKYSDDTLIRSVCTPIPAIKSHTPDSISEQFANTPVNVYFTTNIEEPETLPENSLFNYDNISITYKESHNKLIDMSDYFYPPVYDSSKEKLTLKPISDDLLDFMYQEGVDTLQIEFKFSEKITMIINDEVYPLKQNEHTSFSVLYINEKENTSPIKQELIITKDKITLADTEQIEQCTSLKDFYELRDSYYSLNMENTDELTNYMHELAENILTDSFYIYGKYFDADSGVSDVVVNNTIYNINSDNAEFYTDENGYTSFCIKYDAVENEGNLCYVDIYVCDACGNETLLSFDFICTNKTKIITSINIKNGLEDYYDKLEAEDISPYAFASELIDAKLIDWNSQEDPEAAFFQFTEDFNKSLKTFTIENISADFEIGTGEHENDKIPYKSTFEKYTCEYTDTNGEFHREDFEKSEDSGKYVLELNSEFLSGTDMTVIMEDNYGLSIKYRFNLPPKFIINLGGIESGFNEGILICKDSDGKLKRANSFFDVSWTVDEGETALGFTGILPSPNNESNEFSKFLFPMTDFFLIDLSNETLVITEFSHDYDRITRKPVVTFKLAENTWEKFDTVYLHVRGRSDYHEYKIFNGPELKFTWTPENLIYIRYEDPSTWRYNEYFFDDEVPAKFYLKGGKNGCAPDENHEVYKYAYFDPSAYDEDNQCYKYDSVPPMAKMNFTNYENITFTVEDFLGKGSGVKSARIEIQNKVYQINTEPYTLTLPLHGIADYMTLPTTDKFKYTASDKAGNTITSEIWNRFVESDIDHISTLNNSQISIHYNSSNINRHADVYTLSEENVWTLIKSADWKKDSYYYFTFNDNSVTNKWVKLSAYNKDEYDSSTIPLSSPYFIYMGNESSPLYDSMIKNGNTTSSVTVTSDSPVYVHTLCTRNSNCSAWNARQWCLLGKEVDSAVLNFSSTDTRNKSYTINSYNFKHNIPAGAYYVIISHFARNDPNEQYTFMTEPVKK